jgi:hypothetical protein
VSLTRRLKIIAVILGLRNRNLAVMKCQNRTVVAVRGYQKLTVAVLHHRCNQNLLSQLLSMIAVKSLQKNCSPNLGL